LGASAFLFPEYIGKEESRMIETYTTIEHGKVPRKALRLMPLHFIVCDDWLDKLGEKSFILWLRLYTKVDRTDDRKDTVKYSQKALAKSLEMSKSTLLRLLKPLYEYGLIDYIRYEMPDGNVCENIIVYEFPQNNPALQFEPLEKCRSWEQRTDERYSFTKKGGRPKKEEASEQPEQQYEQAEQKQEQKQEEPKQQTAELNDNVPDVVKTEFEHFKDGMAGNGAALDVVVNWLNKNATLVHKNAMCYVIKQLATYPEPVKKTAVFIENAMKHASSFHRPVTAWLHEMAEEEVQERKSNFSFYNWLEDDNDDM
jgi:hypothetical protein